jgi:predicted nuclease with TOPRIM domain
LNDVNFSQEEQIKDLKIQLSSKTAEIKTLEESIKSKLNDSKKGSQDNEDRLKKMKGLLLAANKKITEYRNQNSLHESEVDGLKLKIKELEDKEKETFKEIEDKEGGVCVWKSFGLHLTSL